MSGLSALFVDVKTLPQDGFGFFQLLFLGGTYAYLLFYGSNLISDGSELLLLVPNLAGVVGSIVLPVLGAVPDGCIVLFSGMGPDAQTQLTVGVGALAGSTIMLLTVPWFLSILGGRVNIDPKTKLPRYKAPKLTPPDFMSLTETGVSLSASVNVGAYIMIATSVTYLLLQVPGMVYLHTSVEEQAKGEKYWAVFGTIVCLASFIAYLYYQYSISNKPDTTQALSRDEFLRLAIHNKEITLLGIMAAEYNHMKEESERTDNGEKRPLNATSRDGYQGVEVQERDSLKRSASPRHLPGFSDEFTVRLERILKPFFHAYDYDNSGSLCKDELQCVFADLGEKVTPGVISELFDEFDKDKSGTIDYKEFVQGVGKYIVSHLDLIHKHNRTETRKQTLTIEDGPDGEDEEDEEEEEMPDDFKDLSPDEQQKRIKAKSAWMMGLGTAILVLISDPMVDVLSELGVRTGIPAFYIAFVLAPLASNASELIAAFNYAKKKTPTSISISLATLEGAAIMNNTFVLGIFMLLICTQSLAWSFFAETLSILLVEVAMALMALKKTHTMLDAWMILSLYPISLIIVAVLEAIGWD